MTSEDIKHQLIIIITKKSDSLLLMCQFMLAGFGEEKKGEEKSVPTEELYFILLKNLKQTRPRALV